MQGRLHPATVVLALAVIGLAAFLISARDLGSPPRGPVVARGGLPPPVHEPALGIMCSPSTDPRGIKVMGFRPPPEPSPLRLLGVAIKDTIVSINGEVGFCNDLVAAIRESQREGTPLVLGIQRGGELIELRLERLPPLPGPLGEPPRATDG